MALSDAAVVALARELYPDVTTAVASDAYLLAWVPWAREQVGLGEWLAMYDTGVAMLLAARGQLKASGAAGGLATSVSTLQMSVTRESLVTSGSISDRRLASTAAGSDYLALREVIPASVLPFTVPMP